MNVVVTGAAGFIGSATVRQLLADGHYVLGVDNLSSGKEANLADCSMGKKSFMFEKADCGNGPYMRKLFEAHRTDYVIHLAAVANMPKCEAYPQWCFEQNVENLFNLLRASQKAEVRRFVFASSAAVYGQTVKQNEETEALRPISLYGASKAAGEQFVSVFNRNGMETVSLRYFNVYGERQDPSSPYSGVISKFLAAKKVGAPLLVYGSGLAKRDFVYVRDVAKANALALRCTPGVYNVCTGVTTTILELAQSLSDNIKREEERKGDPLYSHGDPLLARAVMGFEARHTLLTGLQSMTEAAA